MTSKFSGGVRDDDARRGFVPVGPRDVAAVALEDGRHLWTRKGVGIPVAANDTHLVTLDHSGNQFVLRILNAASGDEAMLIPDFGMPDNADETFGRSDAMTITATEAANGLKISWAVRLPYRGGSPPPLARASPQNEWRGAVLVDAKAGSVSPATPEKVEPELVRAPLGAHAISAPGVMSFDPIGNRLFSLRMRAADAGETAVVLDAVDSKTGDRLWETELGKVRSVAPSRPRP